MALRVTSEAIQVHGGYGFTDEFAVSRFYRGARYGTLGRRGTIESAARPDSASAIHGRPRSRSMAFSASERSEAGAEALRSLRSGRIAYSSAEISPDFAGNSVQIQPLSGNAKSHGAAGRGQTFPAAAGSGQGVRQRGSCNDRAQGRLRARVSRLPGSMKKATAQGDECQPASMPRSKMNRIIAALITFDYSICEEIAD